MTAGRFEAVFAAYRIDEAADGRGFCGKCADVFGVDGGFLGGNFLCFGGKDFIENVGHVVFRIRLGKGEY